MDWHSRYVLAWEVSVTMDEGFCASALRRHGHPWNFNADQASQSTGESFTGVLKAAGVDISMDSTRRAVDNIMVERLWRSVKYEEVYLKDYEGASELVVALRVYFDFYNHERPYQSHRGVTLAEAFRGEAQLALAA